MADVWGELVGINQKTGVGAGMSGPGGGADVLETWPESPLLANSGHAATG